MITVGSLLLEVTGRRLSCAVVNVIMNKMQTPAKSQADYKRKETLENELNIKIFIN